MTDINSSASKPVVSVILPVFNRAELICRAIESVLLQTFTDFELLVINDGSTDRTADAIDSVADARVRMIRQANRGVSAARNAGLAAAAGRYIAFLDSDDQFLPNKLGIQVAFLDTHPESGLVYGEYVNLMEDGREQLSQMKCKPDLEISQLLLGPAYHTSTILVRSFWLREVGAFNEQLSAGEEWELGLRLALAGCRMDCVPEPLALVQHYQDSLTWKIHRHVDKILAALETVFADPRMPADLFRDRENYRASLLFRHAALAFFNDDFEDGRALFSRALGLVRDHLHEEKPAQLLNRFVSLIVGLDPEHAGQRLNDILDNLTTSGAIAAPQLEHLIWAAFHLEMAYRCFEARHRMQAYRHSLEAIRLNPRNLFHRGLIKQIAKSLV